LQHSPVRRLYCWQSITYSEPCVSCVYHVGTTPYKCAKSFPNLIICVLWHRSTCLLVHSQSFWTIVHGRHISIWNPYHHVCWIKQAYHIIVNPIFFVNFIIPVAISPHKNLHLFFVFLLFVVLWSWLTVFNASQLLCSDTVIVSWDFFT
jgi:hypothetical protein